MASSSTTSSCASPLRLFRIPVRLLTKDSYFIIQNLASSKEEIIRYSALLRGTESAWQAVSYGLESITVMAQVGGIYMNFTLWAVAIVPAWLVIRHFGDKQSPDAEEEVTSSSESDAKY